MANNKKDLAPLPSLREKFLSWVVTPVNGHSFENKRKSVFDATLTLCINNLTPSTPPQFLQMTTTENIK